MFGPLRRVKFLITAPFIVLMLFVINVMTSPGEWWVQWAAFGIGIAWVINLFKLIRDIVAARRPGRLRRLPLQPQPPAA